MILHTVGDSHSLFPWQAVRLPWLEVRCHHLGSRLMHSFARDRGALVNLRALGVEDGQVVCFCFGEIDCRRHVHCRAGSGVRWVIKQLTDGYFEAIADVTAGYSALTVLVAAVVPPRRYSRPSRAFWDGPDEARLGYVQTMNAQLRVKCCRAGYRLVDAWDEAADDAGFLRLDKSDGKTHVMDTTGLELWLEANLKGR